jgi:hypothetical protein
MFSQYIQYVEDLWKYRMHLYHLLVPREAKVVRLPQLILAWVVPVPPLLNGGLMRLQRLEIASA